MKRFFQTSVTVIFLFLLIVSADFNPTPAQVATEPTPKQAKNYCIGYTIIEAGKGVDCNGDTIKLVKEHGYYEIASRQRPGSPQTPLN